MGAPVLWNGLYVLEEDWASVLVFLATAFGMGVWLTRLLPEKGRGDPARMLPLCLCAGAIPLAMLSFAAVFLARLWAPALPIGVALITCLGASGAILWLATVRAQEPRPQVVVLIPGAVFFLIILVVRLSFLRGLLLPPGFDSAAHVEIIRDFLSPQSPPQASRSLVNLLHRYYHFGFDSLGAWLALATGLKAQAVVSLLGQLFLALSPLAIFGLAAVATDSYPAAFAVGGLAFLGWRLPAFTANWGRYPALAGIALLPSALGMLLLAWNSGSNRWSAGLLGFLLMAGEVLIQTRIVICAVLALLGFALAGEVVRGKRIPFWASLLLGALLALLSWTQLKDVVQNYGDWYYRVLVVVLLLSPLAFWCFPRLALAIGFYTLGLVLVRALPVPPPLRTYASAWLDLPFLVTQEYIPLALLGGMGLGGLLRLMKRPWLQGLAGLGFVSILLWNAAGTQSFSPDPYYNYVRPVDVAAIAWIGQHAAADARVIISGTASSDPEFRGLYAASDAGVWVEPLTGRRTTLKPYNMKWTSPRTKAELCGLGSAYVYAGGWPFGFDSQVLDKLGWLTPIVQFPPVVIFRVDCSGGGG